MRDDRAKHSVHSKSARPRTEEADRRSADRHPLIAAAEVIEPRSGARISARTSDLGLTGCYIDALTPFPKGSEVRLRLHKGSTIFECQCKVTYSTPGQGMGLIFEELTPEQQHVLKTWMAGQSTMDDMVLDSLHAASKADESYKMNRTPMGRLIRLLIRKGILTESEAATVLRDTDT